MGDFTSRDFKRPEHQEFYKLLRDVSPSGAVRFYTLFEDFLTLAHAALYQPVHKLLTGDINAEIEAEYLRVVRKYDKPKVKNFSAALGTLVCSIDTELHDFLGDVYGCTEIMNHWNGQFFTPWPLCMAMAELVIGDSEPDPKHRLTIQEPAVGGGAMLLAVATQLIKRKFTPRSWWFEATDNDLRCAHMAYIQLSLSGCAGIVHHGNSLSLEHWAAWPTMMGALFPHHWDEKDVLRPKPDVKLGQLELDLA
jgi:hypothetical protein